METIKTYYDNIINFFKKLFNDIKNQIIKLYDYIKSLFKNEDKNNDNNDNKSCDKKCGHDHNRKEYQEILRTHENLMRSVQQSGKIVDFQTILNKNIKITIPLVFHILDRDISSQKWEDHINNNIIKVLNTDYNQKGSNFKTQFTNMMQSIMANADPNKKKMYMNVVNNLSKYDKITWEFKLDQVIYKPVSYVDPSTRRLVEANIDYDNEILFKNIQLIDPENYLNIVVCKSFKGILGISVFPFSDRSQVNESIIDPSLRYRNGILISTDTFLGKGTQYNLYRTLTHEIGHWCGLLHPFDNTTFRTDEIKEFGLQNVVLESEKTDIVNGVNQHYVGDLIADTMTQQSPTYGVVRDVFTRSINYFTRQATINHTGQYSYIFSDRINRHSNFYNFMDYTDDIQMVMFTNDQILKMVYLMSRFRPNFVTIF